MQREARAGDAIGEASDHRAVVMGFGETGRGAVLAEDYVREVASAIGHLERQHRRAEIHDRKHCAISAFQPPAMDIAAVGQRF